MKRTFCRSQPVVSNLSTVALRIKTFSIRINTKFHQNLLSSDSTELVNCICFWAEVKKCNDSIWTYECHDFEFCLPSFVQVVWLRTTVMPGAQSSRLPCSLDQSIHTWGACETPLDIKPEVASGCMEFFSTESCLP